MIIVVSQGADRKTHYQIAHEHAPKDEKREGHHQTIVQVAFAIWLVVQGEKISIVDERSRDFGERSNVWYCAYGPAQPYADTWPCDGQKVMQEVLLEAGVWIVAHEEQLEEEIVEHDSDYHGIAA